MQKIKNNLIAYGIAIDNEYLDKYIQLCLNNKVEPIKGKTNLHHIIPVAYYKEKYSCATRRIAEKYAKDDLNNICVNLLFKDHILAHYYLALCAKSTKYIFALNYLLSIYKKQYNLQSILESAVLNNLDNYQKLYELGRQQTILAQLNRKQNRTAEWNNKISAANSGLKKMIRNNIETAIPEEKVFEYMQQGWQLGVLPKTAETRLKIKAGCKKYYLENKEKVAEQRSGENNPAKRPEVRKKLSEKAKQRILNNEIRQKISKTKKGQGTRPIKIFGITYASISKALKCLHIGYYTLLKIKDEG